MLLNQQQWSAAASRAVASTSIRAAGLQGFPVYPVAGKGWRGGQCQAAVRCMAVPPATTTTSQDSARLCQLLRGHSTFGPTSKRRVYLEPKGTALVKRPAALPEALTAALEPLAASPYRDFYCLAVTVLGSIIWVKIFDVLASKGVLEQKLSRKLVHTTTGPIYAATWALFSADPSARFLAAIAPFLNLMRLVSVATGVVRDDGLVASVSRSGDRGELLKGPSYYCIALIAACTLCWRDNPAGLIALSLMCGGDGLADIVGRRLGHLGRLPYNPSKSYAGSVAMFLGGLAFSLGFVLLFCSMGFFPCVDPTTLLPVLVVISAAATLVESLPINSVFDDNLSVPLLAAGLSLLLLPVTAAASPVMW